MIHVSMRWALGTIASSVGWLLVSTQGLVEAAWASVPDLLVSGFQSAAVFRFEGQSGHLMRSYGGSLLGPEGIVLPGDGTMFVANFALKSITRFDLATGQVLATFGQGFYYRGMTLGPEGLLYVAYEYGPGVRRFTQDGQDLGLFASGGGMSRPDGVIFGPDGNLYVADQANGGVYRFDGANGQFLDVFVKPGNSGGLRSAQGLNFGPDGNLYVGGGEDSAVFRFDGRTGSFLDVFVPPRTGGLDGAEHVVFGGDGLMYVSGYRSNRIHRYDAKTGRFMDTWGAGTGLKGPTYMAFVPEPAGLLLLAAGMLAPRRR